jgi:hypothetical protein
VTIKIGDMGQMPMKTTDDFQPPYEKSAEPTKTQSIGKLAERVI